jgi:hypothetical protein
MEILLYRHNVHLLACPAAIFIRGRMQGLMNVTNQMNQKRQVVFSSPFVIVPLAKAPFVLIDLGGDAIFLWASGR